MRNSNFWEKKKVKLWFLKKENLTQQKQVNDDHLDKNKIPTIFMAT